MQSKLLLFDHPDVCARAEEALRAPDSCLGDLARFLGMSDDPASLEEMRHPEGSEYALGGSGELEGYWDPGFLARPELRPPVVLASLRAPPEWALPQSLNERDRRAG